MSSIGHPPWGAPTATAAGAIAVEEYGYGLGPPTGVLVLRYPPQAAVPDFPPDRDDFVHQLFWSPDGVLAVHRGDTSRFLSSAEMLWVRRGVVAEVHGLGRQTVLRVCVRQAPASLTALEAGVLAPEAEVGGRLLEIARPGVEEQDGLRARHDVLEALAGCRAVHLGHVDGGAGPAHTVAQALLHDPADPTSLTDWAARLHVSDKTLQRHFVREFGTTFTAWRTTTRLRAAAAMLRHLSVTETAHRVGYTSVSAFTAAFTREFGTSPGRYAG
ncbi:AraC family transcriptional regulator [Nocardioides sp. zg-1228]|uniref:helix-turn-helix transcriptional regulator n=1 Tax=Nocardioides sp. zg-1228 TaxID=2763008 RepID=UPI001F11B707|nr:AraC family transcriptional regulator [Nocardioides sp. zg-1228]